MPLTARFHGTCAECGETISPGQRIETGDDDGWRHYRCDELPQRVECVCSRCWLVHAPQQRECA